MNKELSLIYDKFAVKYEENRGLFDMSEVINDFEKKLTVNNGHLLDLGCGAGEPFPAFFLNKNWQVTGVDFSHKMLDLAKEYLPEMKTIYSDMTEVSFTENSFDAITAVYSLFHTEKEKHQNLFGNMYKWLKNKGVAMFTYACKEYTGYDSFSGYIEFMGEQLFYSHMNINDLEQILYKTGFSNVDFKYRNIGGETFLWVIAIK